MVNLVIEVVAHPVSGLPHIKPHFLDEDYYVSGERTVRFFEIRNIELEIGEKYQVKVLAFLVLDGKTRDKRMRIKLFVKAVGKVLYKSEIFRINDEL